MNLHLELKRLKTKYAEIPELQGIYTDMLGLFNEFTQQTIKQLNALVAKSQDTTKIKSNLKGFLTDPAFNELAQSIALAFGLCKSPEEKQQVHSAILKSLTNIISKSD